MALTAPTEPRVTTPGEIDAEFARIVDELTRRGLLTGGLGAALVGLSGCGSGPDDTSSAASTRTVETPIGTTITAPSRPRRVIALANALEPCLELGVPVVGTWTNAENAVPSKYKAQVTKLPKVSNSSGEIDLEVVAKLKPDLVFAWSSDPTLPQLSKIASVFPYDSTSSIVTWQTSTQQTAYAVNRIDAFNSLANAYAQRIAALKSAYSAQLSTAKWYVVWPDSASDFTLEGTQRPGPAALQALGASFGSAQKAANAATGGLETVSMERLSDLSDAQVIVFDDNGYGAEKGSLVSPGGQQLMDQPGWKALPAVKAGNVFVFNAYNIGGYGTATSYLDAIESMCKHLKNGR